MDSLKVKAYAKINLAFEILSTRQDGFHEVQTILQSIDLYDELEFISSRRIAFYCDVQDLNDADNLAYRALCLLKNAYSVHDGIEIRLRKCIPIGAGLGGGSTDAATVLRVLNDFWGLSVSLDELTLIAAKLGSDVPFFLTGGTAYASGKGEVIETLPPIPKTWVVLVNPGAPLVNKTSILYGMLQANHFTSGMNIDLIVKSIHAGNQIPEILMRNTFEEIEEEIFPGNHYIRQMMMNRGAPSVHLTGSGPSLFALVPTRENGEQITHDLFLEGIEAMLVSTISEG